MDRRSIGKKLIKLRAVRLDGQPMTVEDSLGIIGLILAIIEAIMALTDPEGRRLGDKLANTKVIEVQQ